MDINMDDMEEIEIKIESDVDDNIPKKTQKQIFMEKWK